MLHDKARDEATKWLPFVPMMAGWIEQNTLINEQEITILRNSYTHIYIFLSDTSYEELKEQIASLADHPVYGGYVRVILSQNGERWLTAVIDAINKNKRSEDT